jgi:hypothetical protein
VGARDLILASHPLRGRLGLLEKGVDLRTAHAGKVVKKLVDAVAAFTQNLGVSMNDASVPAPAGVHFASVLMSDVRLLS